jgi:dolichol kinase
VGASPPSSQREGSSGNELLRKSIHMAVGLGAFAVVLLGPSLSALLALALLVFNVFVWPRLGGRTVWRERDSRRGVAVGIVLYPAVLLVLILVFWRRLEIVAAVWAVLAFGDGMAAIAGSALGGPRLPWNPLKSWAGSLAFGIFGAFAAAAALWWTLAFQGRDAALIPLAAAAATTALAAAAVESLPSGLDDNLTVPLVSALCLWGLLG